VDIIYQIILKLLLLLLLILFRNKILRSPNLIVVVSRNSYPTSQKKVHLPYKECDQAMLVIGVHKVQVLLKMDYVCATFL